MALSISGLKIETFYLYLSVWMLVNIIVNIWLCLLSIYCSDLYNSGWIWVVPPICDTTYNMKTNVNLCENLLFVFHAVALWVRMYKMLLLVWLTLAATVCGDWTDDHCTQVRMYKMLLLVGLILVVTGSMTAVHR